MGYFKDIIKGVSWMGGFRLFSRFIALGRTAILARLLLPAQFGVYGIATLVLAFLEIFTETGINIFLVQEKKNIDEYIDTAWIVSIVRGTLISLLVLLVTPLIVFFFNSPDARPLLLLISLVPFLRGFINPSIVKFQKELQFDKEFWFRSSIFIFNSTIAVILVLLMHSPISLIWGLIAGTALEVALSFIFVKPTPRLSFEIDRVRKVIDRGKWVTGAGIFQYLFRQGDDIVVGKLLGESSLGLYQVAYRISTLPITEVADVFAKVTFPVYAKISSQSIRLKRAFIKTTLGISALVVPFGLFLFVFSNEVVLVVLGKDWLGAVPVLKVLSLFGIVRGVTGAVYPFFFAVHKQRYVALITLVSILGLAASIVPLVNRFGIVGAGMSTIIGAVVALPVVFYCLLRVFKELEEKAS